MPETDEMWLELWRRALAEWHGDDGTPHKAAATYLRDWVNARFVSREAHERRYSILERQLAEAKAEIERLEDKHYNQMRSEWP